MPARRRRHDRAELERRRSGERLADGADALPVEHPVRAGVLQVEWLTGADHGDQAGRRVSKGGEHRRADIADLDAIAPLGIARHEAGMELSERGKLVAFRDIAVEDCEEIDVALARHEAASGE